MSILTISEFQNYLKKLMLQLSISENVNFEQFKCFISNFEPSKIYKFWDHLELGYCTLFLQADPNQNLLQGDPNRNYLFQMTVTLKVCIYDPMLLKPKWV